VVAVSLKKKRQITWKQRGKERDFHDVDLNGLVIAEPQYFRAIVTNKQSPFTGRRFKRLAAERNIIPESLQPATPKINSSGQGATQAINHFLRNSTRDKNVITSTLLQDLNAIFTPDATFTDIDAHQLQSGDFEIYLYEAGKRVALSQSGSGLKTVLLVLIYIHLVPPLENTITGTYVYAFEELENNLHPAVQRRLLRFLRDTVERTDCTIFLSTHSPVEIDFFARDPLAQVLHVTHTGTLSTVTAVTGHAEHRYLLDDLDLRASDILQSNGIIWVEGPSDRIYLNKWIELWTDGQLREGAHYQVIFYGGKLLSHLTATDSAEEQKAINILTTNRHVAILIDSDKEHPLDTITTTKQRVQDEVIKAGGYAWITDGREIENTIPTDILLRTTGLATTPGPYDDVQGLLKADNAVMAKFADKIKLAQAITPQLQREHLASLATDLDQLVALIKTWNGA